MHEVLISYQSIRGESHSVEMEEPAAKRGKKYGAHCGAERKGRTVARSAEMHHSILQLYIGG